MTLLREARKWWNLEIENEGDLLDIVIERPEDLDHLTFNWKTIGFDMANDGLVGSPSDAALNDQMEFLAGTLSHLDNLNLFSSCISHLPRPDHNACREGTARP